MITKQRESKDNKKSIDVVIARVAGATQVAGAAVSETMSMKDEAIDKVRALNTRSNTKEKTKAIDKLTKDTNKLRK